jgi:hypothetical protein
MIIAQDLQSPIYQSPIYQSPIYQPNLPDAGTQGNNFIVAVRSEAIASGYTTMQAKLASWPASRQ